MKNMVTRTSGITLLLVLALVAFCLTTDQPVQSSGQITQGTPTYNRTPQDVDYLARVPVYPNATLSSNNQLGKSDIKRVIYSVDASESLVYDWYETALATDGWTKIPGNTGSVWGEWYTWSDPQGVVPWHLALNRAIDDSTGHSEVTLVFHPYSNITNDLPLPTAAQDLHSEGSIEAGDLKAGRVLTTTYTINLSKEEVVQYYQTNLPNQGWSLRDGSDADLPSLIPPNLVELRFSTSWPGRTHGNDLAVVLAIHIEESEAKSSRVVLRAKMTEMPVW